MGLIAKFLARHKPVFIVTRRVSHPLISTSFARLKYKNGLIDGYIAVAEAVRALLVAYGLSGDKVRVIYSGTDTSRFRPSLPDSAILDELNLSPGRPVIMLAGNFSFDKGQHVLLRAAKLLYDRGRDFIVVFAGRGTDSGELRDLFLREGLPEERGRFLGLRHDVERLLSVASLSVNAAVKGEALSGSVREALAMGVPAVASDISGNSELVEDGLTGLLFPPGDAAALAGRIEALLDKPELRSVFSKNSVALVREKFSAQVMAERTLAYYRELLAAR